MRIIATGVVIALLLWGGYWAYAKHLIETQISAVMTTLRVQGGEASYDDLSISGFPYRFMMKAQNLDIAPPGGDLRWKAPEVTAHALAYNPKRILFDFHNQQNFELYGQDLTLTADALRASAQVVIAQNLPLADARIEGQTLLLGSEYGWDLRVEHLLGALRIDPTQSAEGATYDTYLRLKEVTLPENVRAALDPSQALPSALTEIALNGKLHLSQLLDRFNTAPQIEAIQIDDVHLQWGDIYFEASLNLEADFQGLLKGEIELRLTEWQQALALVEGMGVLQGDRARMAQMALSAVAEGNKVEITLPVRDGGLFMGPLKIWQLQ